MSDERGHMDGEVEAEIDVEVDVDREAILARRRELLGRALDGLVTTTKAGAVAVVTAAGLTACPRVCLSVVFEDEESGCGMATDTGETETGGTETDGTDTDC